MHAKSKSTSEITHFIEGTIGHLGVRARNGRYSVNGILSVSCGHPYNAATTAFADWGRAPS
jgi:hypothetical protein